jgi:hypothetical protein
MPISVPTPRTTSLPALARPWRTLGFVAALLLLSAALLNFDVLLDGLAGFEKHAGSAAGLSRSLTSIENTSEPASSSSPAARDASVAIFYHVGMMHNWQTVVSDQLSAIRDSGLLLRAHYVAISLLANTTAFQPDQTGPYLLQAEFSELTRGISPLLEAKMDATFEGDLSRFEYPTLLRVYQYCRSRRSASDTEDHLVLYLHSKGVSSGASGEVAARRSMEWRRAMEHFLVWNWQDCADAMTKGSCSSHNRLLYTVLKFFPLADKYDVCGINFMNHLHWSGFAHFSGKLISHLCLLPGSRFSSRTDRQFLVGHLLAYQSPAISLPAHQALSGQELPHAEQPRSAAARAVVR